VTTADVTDVILKALAELNQMLPPGKQIPVAPDVVLSDDGGHLDSLGLVNLILAVEKGVAEQFGVQISLSDERALTQDNSPFRNARALAEYVSRLIDEKRDA
jgi:acyl carrier protein